MEIDYRDENMKRIADALEEILRLVKEDQERSRKYMEEKKDEWKKRVRKYPGPGESLALASGTRAKQQAASCKRQAASGKLDKTTL